MLHLDSFSYAGKITATHGIKGELSCNINDEAIQGLVETDVIFLMIEGGLVPYFIEENGLRLKGNSSVLITLEENTSKEIAEKLISLDIYLPNELVEEVENDSIVGYMVIDKSTNLELGEVEEVLEYSENILLQITYKDEEVLLPYNDMTISEFNEDDQKIYLNIPDGLLDM